MPEHADLRVQVTEVSHLEDLLQALERRGAVAPEEPVLRLERVTPFTRETETAEAHTVGEM